MHRLQTVLAQGYYPPMTPDAVRRLRQQLGLTQSKFADLLGVHKITVAKWEAGMKGMSATTLRLLRVLSQQGAQALAPPRRRRPGTTRRRKGR
jgi:DNA-binding transcriptional regulator YiaG